MSIKALDLNARLSIDCTGCQANAHQYEYEEKINVTGYCGDNHNRGACFGVILYPIKNPSQANHVSFSQSVKFNAEKA
jgi:hypothetical protein